MNFKKLISFKALTALGFVATAIPLFVAVVHSAATMREASALGRELNTRIFEQTQNIRLVLQKTSDVERKARLFVLLSDPALRQPYERESYEATRTTFKQALNELLKLRVDNRIALLANELAEKEVLIYQQIIGSASEDDIKLPLDEAFQSLRESAATLSRDFETYVDQRFRQLNRQSAALERDVMIKGGLLAVISALLVIGVVYVQMRAISQLERAVRGLSGGVTEPILLTGLEDWRQLGNRLEWLRNRLHELEYAKHQTMAGMTRQIATPLAALKIGLHSAGNGGDPGGLHDAVADLQALYDDCLRQLNDSQFSQEPEEKDLIDLENLIDEVASGLRAKFRAKSLHLKKQTQPAVISGVADQLHLIVEQLLLLAWAHAPEDSEITLRLRLQDTELELEIEDEGPAINPALRSAILEPFFRFPAGSFGDLAELNLETVKTYIANHQGKLAWVDGEPGLHGNRFRLSLPMLD